MNWQHNQSLYCMVSLWCKQDRSEARCIGEFDVIESLDIRKNHLVNDGHAGGLGPSKAKVAKGRNKTMIKGCRRAKNSIKRKECQKKIKRTGSPIHLHCDFCWCSANESMEG